MNSSINITGFQKERRFCYCEMNTLTLQIKGSLIVEENPEEKGKHDQE